MSLTPSAQDIDNASTKGLQELTAQMTGKPCNNRNAKAMRARLHSMIIDRKAADDAAIKEVIRETEHVETSDVIMKAPASPFGVGPSEPQTGKPAKKEKPAPAKKEKVAKPAKAAPKKKEKPAKPEAEKPAPAKKERAARAEKALAEKPAPAKKEKVAKPAKAAPKKKEKPAKPAKKERADKGVNRKPARAPRPANPARLHTKATLADLPVNTILVHNFRGGESVRVRVAEAPAKDGSGGVFFYKNSKYNGLKGLRAIVLEVSGVAWNVLMFFRREDTGELLQPYPQHAKKEPAAA